VVIFGGLGMTLLIPTLFTASLWAIAGLFAVSTFAYAAFSTMAIVLASDVFRDDAVATVSGMSGTGAGLGTILSTFLIGKVADHYSFEPVLLAASIIPLIGAVLVLLLVRNTRETEAGRLRRI
jgi:MFS transporter, ACS family, hexuronate transporter